MTRVRFWQGTLSIFELRAREATGRVVMVPQSWIDRCAKQKRSNAWEQLYRWLIDEHGATHNPTLHRRTFAGAELMRRLMAAERARLESCGLRGKALRQNLWFSNAGSGPMESHDLWKLTGDALLWVPFSAAWMRGGAAANE